LTCGDEDLQVGGGVEELRKKEETTDGRTSRTMSSRKIRDAVKLEIGRISSTKQRILTRRRNKRILENQRSLVGELFLEKGNRKRQSAIISTRSARRCVMGLWERGQKIVDCGGFRIGRGFPGS
jgi:hypothetical protein